MYEKVTEKVDHRTVYKLQQWLKTDKTQHQSTTQQNTLKVYIISL